MEGDNTIRDEHPYVFSGGSRISPRKGRKLPGMGGRQHTILLNFLKNYMELKEIGHPRSTTTLASISVILTARKRSCEKVMFSKVSVIKWRGLVPSGPFLPPGPYPSVRLQSRQYTSYWNVVLIFILLAKKLRNKRLTLLALSLPLLVWKSWIRHC